MNTETFDKLALIPAILSDWKRVCAFYLSDADIEELRQQEPLNDIAQLPAEEQPTQTEEEK